MRRMESAGRAGYRPMPLDETKAHGASPARLFGSVGLPTGAGEAIRTPDPNLGKVVLYP